MHKYLILFLLLINFNTVFSQNCFDAYDKIFENGADTLNHTKFKEREQFFLNELIGCEAPDFSGTTLEDKDILLSGLKGKVVVLNFWFTNCLPCLKEIPLLNELTEEFGGEEVIFIALARDDSEKLNAFFKRFQEFKYQIIPESHEIADVYKVIAWPQSMVIDKKGRVFKAWAGAEESVEDLVNDIHSTIDECLSDD